MDVFEALYTTRAMRRVRPDPIPAEVQASILDAAIRAPSGGNSQRWRFVLVDDPAVREALAALYRSAFRTLMETAYAGPIEAMEKDPDAPASIELGTMLRSGRYLADHFADVPLLLFAFTRHDPTGQSLLPAVWSAMLAARAHGVGSALTTVLTLFAAEQTATILGMPPGEGWSNPCAVTFGYPLGRWAVAARRPAADVTYRNAWGRPAGLDIAGPLWP